MDLNDKLLAHDLRSVPAATDHVAECDTACDLRARERDEALARGVAGAFAKLNAAMAEHWPEPWDVESCDGMREYIRDELVPKIHRTRTGSPGRHVDLSHETGNSAAQYWEQGEADDYACPVTSVRVRWTDRTEGPPTWIKMETDNWKIVLWHAGQNYEHGIGRVDRYTVECVHP